MRQEGKLRLVGVSNTDVGQIRVAASITRLSAVQNEFSCAFLSSIEELRLCAELGIAFLPWSPLGGIGRAGGQPSVITEVASQYAVSPQQVVIAWMLSQSPTVLPIPGASRPSSIMDSALAASLTLDRRDLERIDQALGLSGRGAPASG